jgi:alpha-L-fucosidase 2
VLLLVETLDAIRPPGRSESVRLKQKMDLGAKEAGSNFLRGVAILFLLPRLCLAQHADPTLWYNKPAPVWTQALPIGNGTIGGMVFGGANRGTNNGDQESNAANRDVADGKQTRAQDEHLQLNEDTVWQGSRADRLNPKAREGVQEIRKLLLESKGLDGAKIREAGQLANQTMPPTPRGLPSYSTLGDLYVRSADETQPNDYRRELNLNTGVVTVTYTAGGVHYRRKPSPRRPTMSWCCA